MRCAAVPRHPTLQLHVQVFLDFPPRPDPVSLSQKAYLSEILHLKVTMMRVSLVIVPVKLLSL